MADKIVQLQNENGDNIFPICRGLGNNTVTNDAIDWSTLCAAGKETVTTTMAVSYTRFFTCNNSIRPILGGHAVIFSGYLDLGGASGSATINKTAVPGLNGYYGYKTNSQVPIAPNSTMVYSSVGFSILWVPGSGSGNDRWYGNDTRAIAISTDGYIYLGVGTGSSESVGSWQRLQLRFPGGVYFIDH